MTLCETKYKGVNPGAWSLALSRLSCHLRICPQLIFKIFINLRVIRRREGMDFSFWIIQNTRFEFPLLLPEKHTFPTSQGKTNVPGYTRIKVHRRNISETSSRGSTNSWHLFNRASLQCLRSATAKTHWKEVWNCRKGSWKGGRSKEAPLT